MTEADRTADFLSRWSHRKTAARRAEAVPQPEPQPTDGEPAPPAECEATSELPETVELPDIETLGAQSDYRPFMRMGVPPELRRDALRKLWRSNPIINSLDGIDDHYVTHDFTDRATVAAGLQTLYRVGKGMLEIADGLDRDVSADRELLRTVAAAAADEPKALANTAEQIEMDDAKSDLAHSS